MEKNPQELKKKGGGRPAVWDCGSSLYDSFELKSFNQQLDSAIGRTQSMPHLTDSCLAHQPPPLPPPPRHSSVSPKRSSKISRSFHKFFRTVFRAKSSNSSTVYQVEEQSKDKMYFVYDRSSAGLSTIPESMEQGLDHMGRSNDQFNNSRVGRAASARFTTASMGISCA
ncbi:hypothetical protein ACHQM5_011743 [Ranunculus cassubicifolius]